MQKILGCWLSFQAARLPGAQRTRRVRVSARSRTKIRQAASFWCHFGECGMTGVEDLGLAGFGCGCGRGCGVILGSSLFQRRADEIFDGGLFTEENLRSFDGIVGFLVFESESDQREHCIV